MGYYVVDKPNETRNIYGNYLDEFTWGNYSSEWNTFGTITNSITSGKLRLSGSAGSFDNGVRWLGRETGNNGMTTLEDYTITMDFFATTGGATGGVYVGTRSSSTYIPYHFQGYANLSSGGSRGKVSVFINGTQYGGYSSTALTYTDGDKLRLTVSRAAFTYTITLSSLTNPSATPASITYVTSPAASSVIGNIGHFCIGSFGGQQDIERYTVTSQRYVNAKYAFIGHSIVVGVDNATYTNSFTRLGAALAGVSDTNYNTFASRGAIYTEALANLKEVLKYKPRVAVVMLGTNEVSVGIALSTFQTNLQTYLARLIAGGVKKVVLVEVPPIGGANTAQVPIFNAWLRSLPYPIVSIYSDLVGTGTSPNASLYNADLIHPNSAGHAIMAAKLKPYL